MYGPGIPLASGYVTETYVGAPYGGVPAYTTGVVTGPMMSTMNPVYGTVGAVGPMYGGTVVQPGYSTYVSAPMMTTTVVPPVVAPVSYMSGGIDVVDVVDSYPVGGVI